MHLRFIDDKTAFFGKLIEMAARERREERLRRILEVIERFE